jgi:hypothetical protein
MSSSESISASQQAGDALAHQGDAKITPKVFIIAMVSNILQLDLKHL